MQKKPSLISLIFLTGFASFSALLYTPGLPKIIDDLQISQNSAHMTMTVFLIGYMIGQLVYGPITHRHGRKPTIYVGIAVGMIGALLCILSALGHSFFLLMIGLFITALGTSVGLVISFAIINDVHSGPEARKIISYATLAFATLPGVAAFIGGILVNYFSWISCFYFLMVYSLFMLLLAIRLPETSNGKDLNALHLSAIIQKYKAVLQKKQIIRYGIIWGLSTNIVYLFAAISPNIAINTLHLSPALFGIVNLVVSAGLVLGNFSSAALVHILNGRKTMLLGIVITAVGCVSLSAVYLLDALALISFYIPVGIIFFGLPLIFTNASVLAAEGATDKATASSMITLLNLTTAVVGTSLINALVSNLDARMPFIFLLITIVIAALFLNYPKKRYAIITS